MNVTHDRRTQIGSLLVSSDRNGNLTSDQNGTTYSYDAQPRRWEGRVRLPKAAPEGRDERERASQNRLIAVTTKTGTTMSVAYDAQYVAMGMARIDCAGAQPRAKAEGRAERERASQNRVVSRTINGDETTYVYDGWTLINEYDSYGIEDAHYIHGPAIDEILSRNATLGGAAYYTQDGNGNVTTLSEKLNGTLIKKTLWDAAGNSPIPLQERNATNGVSKRFFAQGEVQNGTNYYYLRDHLGSIREMVNASGAIVSEATYDPYGVATVSGSVTPTFQYAGYYTHQGTGLNLTWYRAYDPVIGRWLNRDPIGYEGGINLYGYSEDNPVNNVDQLGLLDCHWYGNYGGPGWTNGGWEDKKFPNRNPPPKKIGPPYGPKPWDQTDACYMDHDRCYAMCKNSNCPKTSEELRKCKCNCDRALQRCLRARVKAGCSGPSELFHNVLSDLFFDFGNCL